MFLFEKKFWYTILIELSTIGIKNTKLFSYPVNPTNPKNPVSNKKNSYTESIAVFIRRLRYLFYTTLARAGDTLFSTLSATAPNGLSLAKSIKIGAATKIDE